MEFGVALFGAIMSNALPKLTKWMQKNERDPLKLKEDVRSIQRKLRRIQAAIRTTMASPIGRNSSELQKVSIADLCCLVADLEDYIDSFNVGKMKPDQFSRNIKDLRARTKETCDDLKDCFDLADKITAGAVLISAAPQGQGQQHLPAVAGSWPAVPRNIEEFLGDNSNQSMPRNLNCLLYFCLFPINHPVERNPLIRRWLAEGLVFAKSLQDDDDDDDDDLCSLEDVAAKYLDILLAKEIIQPIQENNGGKVKRYETPREILKCISKLSETTSFMTLCNHKVQEAGQEARRLSVRPGSSTALPERKLVVPEGFSRVRSLAVFPDKKPVSYEAVLDFGKYEVLRLLDLKTCDAVGKSHLKSMFDHLLMLKYLSLGDRIVEVPKRVEKLKMLETLDLGRTTRVAVYSEILELPHLKHLLGKLDLCTKDIWGPRKSKLKKFLSDGSDNGSQLETLSGYVTGQKKGFAKLMSHMKRLKKVKIWCDSTPDEANLKKLKKGVEMFISEGSAGRSLCIDFQKCSKELLEPLEVLEVAPGRGGFWSTPRRPAVSSGPGSIASLKLRGKLTVFPKCVAQMTGIKEMCLSWTKLRGDKIMAGLSNLSNLEYLKLVEEELWPLVIKFEQFKILKHVFLVGNLNLGLRVEDGALPGLVSLYLNCQTQNTVSPQQKTQSSSTVMIEDQVTLAAHVKINHMKKLEKIVLHSALSSNAVDWETAAQLHPAQDKPVVSFLPFPVPVPSP